MSGLVCGRLFIFLTFEGITRAAAARKADRSHIHLFAMRLITPRRENIRAILLCALYAFILLFFLSPDSYIRDLYIRADSAWFFASGKAWMNGMIPYVDFADSKGPLLWLIYGIGYLLSHHSYVGVFWVSIIFYTAMLFFAYKLCRLYLDIHPAAVASAILPFILFFHPYHFEIRAEDFCNSFLMLSLYALCRVLRDWKTLDKRHYFLCAVAMGVTCAACVMIKWNVGVAILVPMFIALLYSFRVKHGMLSICGMLSGFIVVCAPFVIYLLCVGAFDDFIREYFINTTQTKYVRGYNLSPFSILHYAFSIGKRTFFFLLLGLLLFLWKKGKVYWWLFLCFIVMWMIIMGCRPLYYYMSIALPFSIFLIIVLVEMAFRKIRMAARFTPALCLVAACVSIGVNVFPVNESFDLHKDCRQSYYRANYVMAQIKQPKVLYYGLERGIGTPAGSIPACKYWALQNGSTNDMLAEREKTLVSGVADFVIVHESVNGDFSFVEPKHVEDAGYVLYETIGGGYHSYMFLVYGRPGLRLPPDSFYVSDWDVWLKRNIFGI